MPNYNLIQNKAFILDTTKLNHSLNFLKIPELRDLCSALSLPDKGKKGELIERIIHFAETGKALSKQPSPKFQKQEKVKSIP